MNATVTDPRAVLARAAQIIALHGLFHGDFVSDPFNQRSNKPHYLRPMSAVGAINCAVSNDPRTPSNASWAALQLLAKALVDHGGPVHAVSIEDAERRVEAWSDRHSRERVTATLRLLAGSTAHATVTSTRSVAA